MKKVYSSQEFDLWGCYQRIKFRFPEQLSLPFNTFQIVTACNPKSVQLETRLNSLRIQKLQRYFESTKRVYFDVECGDENFGWSESSFAVSLSARDWLNLARLYQQNAIYEVKDGELWLIPVMLKNVKATRLGFFEDFVVDCN